MSSSPRIAPAEYFSLLLRWVIGGLFIYMGLQKALHPVEFLKLLRQYEMVAQPWLLNSIAAVLPWFETLCGTCLVAGVLRRGAATVAVVMLVPFTLIVARRAWAIHAASGTPFCDIKFDCGCGAGEVVICHKLLENGLLTLAALWVAWRPDRLMRLPPRRVVEVRPAES